MCEAGLRSYPGSPWNAQTEFLQLPEISELLVCGIRSKDLTNRAMCAGGLYLLFRKDEPPEFLQMDPNRLATVMSRPWPSSSQRLIMDYGMQRCEFSVILQATMRFQKIMIQVAQDHDLIACGLQIAENITLTEFGVSDGVFQDQLGQIVDVGLPFQRYLDCLPLCAKAIRATGKNLDQVRTMVHSQCTGNSLSS